MRHSFIIPCLFGSALALTSPPSGAITVGGSDGKFKTIQEAVDALSNTTETQNIFVWPGTYEEQVYVSKHVGTINIFGYSANDTSYQANTVTLTSGLSQAFNLTNDLTATLRAHSPNFNVYNLNIENTYGEGSQAVAVSAMATHQGYYASKLTGYQDTLLTHIGKHYFANTYIEGATDFIFGMRSSAWFSNCSLRVPTPVSGTGWITASGRTTADEGWYVIDGGSVEAAPGANVTAGAYYLGRPWRSFARAVFQGVYLSDVVNPEGWAIWSTSQNNTENVTFAEFGNTGPGKWDDATRASFAQELAKKVEIEEVLGADYKEWVDAKF
ncbi:carbohydrate esterase family 8 protein [Diplodia corticola]|uniref:Pectinesterase n=1 Tax=Diplodia corticola TaxID=236234 RepID=A0A1J9R1B3_9PEZI|nr:carbohydrate esterase family 8 protein [Diplodia corticola]OJD34042.1 carbohydrate esterase family 8 protein [Diplodia corticola]